jgi:hypothetical protein
MAKHLNLTDEQYDELRRTGGPLIVRTDDGVDVVVQDAGAYRRILQLLDEIEIARIGRTCSERFETMQRADGMPAEDLIAEMRRRLRDAG